MFKNQNRRSFFILLIMILTLMLFFVYLFIPGPDKKNESSDKVNKTISDNRADLFGGFGKNIRSEITKIFKRQIYLFDIEFVESSFFINSRKKYTKVELEVFTLFDVNFSSFSKKVIQPAWIKDLLRSNGGNFFNLLDLDIRSDKFIINSIAYNEKESFFCIIFGLKYDNIDLIGRVFDNVISFEKKDLIYMFKLIKFGYKVKEIYNDL